MIPLSLTPLRIKIWKTIDSLWHRAFYLTTEVEHPRHKDSDRAYTDMLFGTRDRTEEE